MNRFVLSAILLHCVLISMAELRPRWIKNLPTEGNNSYKFVEIVSYGESVTSARKNALENLAANKQLNKSVLITSSTTKNQHYQRDIVNGQYDSHIHDDIFVTLTVNGDPIKVRANVVDEYIKSFKNSTRIELHTLYQVATTTNPEFDDVRVTPNYGAWGLLSIIPGAGQFYKGAIGKGCMFLGMEAVAIGSIVLCESNHATYITKSYQQPQYMKEYQTQANNWEIGRDISIGAACAIYIWNLIDAFVAPGARRVIMDDNHKTRFSLSPSVEYNSVGLCARYVFQ